MLCSLGNNFFPMSDQNIGSTVGAPLPQPTPETAPVITATRPSEFLQNTETAEKDKLYQDLFQKNADGEMIT